MSLRALVIDAWSWLNYKPVMGDPRQRAVRRAWPELASSWIPESDLRRLAAYKLLAAYDSNQAGQLAQAGGDEAGQERRELGDASKLIDTSLGYLLGSEQVVVVPGAEHAADSEPDDRAQSAAAVQAQLRDWADKELFELRVQQAERAAIRYGDGVYTLAWEPSKGRPILRVVDPGFYFPEWPEDGEDAADFPVRAHFAWELPENPARGLKARLRRITFELGPIGPATKPGQAKGGRPVREWIYGADGEPVLIVGDTADPATGQVTRRYPWAPDKPSGVTCYLTDAEWLLDDLKAGTDVYSLPLDGAAFRVRSDGEVLDRLDLMIDFIPVVHVTNSIPDGGEHWGQSILAKVMQTLDEVAATDTDSASASGTTGAPIIGLSGARLPIDRTTGQPVPVRVQPGTVWQLSDGGSMDVLNTAPQLAELRERIDHLLDRLATNSRLTAAGMGTLAPTALPSGYALQLALGPLDSLVPSMRLARAHKYAILLRMVQRLHQAGRVWPAGPSLASRLMWGPHTPTDRAAVLDEVVKGYAAGVLSLETSIRMLMDAGYAIEDVQEEIERIQQRSFASAGLLADATGDNAAVRQYLGLPAADPGIPAVPPLQQPA